MGYKQNDPRVRSIVFAGIGWTLIGVKAEGEVPHKDGASGSNLSAETASSFETPQLKDPTATKVEVWIVFLVSGQARLRVL